MATTISVNSGAGTGGSATLSADATDVRGTINLSLGTSVPVDTSVATVTFDTAYGAVPHVNLQRADIGANAGALANIAVINKTVNGFDIAFATAGNLSGTSGLKYEYLVTA